MESESGFHLKPCQVRSQDDVVGEFDVIVTSLQQQVMMLLLQKRNHDVKSLFDVMLATRLRPAPSLWKYDIRFYFLRPLILCTNTRIEINFNLFACVFIFSNAIKWSEVQHTAKNGFTLLAGITICSTFLALFEVMGHD